MSRLRIDACIFVHLPAWRSCLNCACGLKTSVGHGKLRARRELAPWRPTTYSDSEAKLNAKHGSAGSEETLAFQTYRHESIWWSCCNPNQRRSSNLFSVTPHGSRNIATNVAKSLARRTSEKIKTSRSRASSSAH